ncbi:MAG: hypothetical protein PWQ57_2434 [Desulfovibrionales bacterium]|jgi:hypothetical protein|nr:hypothetical protein [Desulfovibrionales bacterium]
MKKFTMSNIAKVEALGGFWNAETRKRFDDALHGELKRIM